MIRLHISIDDILHVWARRWASHKECRGYPSLQSFMRESPCIIQRYSITDLSEKNYIFIDNALDALRKHDLCAYQVLMAVYLQGQPRKAICQAMDISAKTYYEWLNAGKYFMSGAVFGGTLLIKL